MSWRTHSLLILALWSGLSATAVCQTMTVREMLQQQEKWPEWARQKKTLNISGRYEGRVAKQFRLSKLNVQLTPTRTTSLPTTIESGQRLAVSGVLQRSGSRYFMDVSRIAVGSTDYERLKAKSENLGPEKPEGWYPLADEYEAIAEFYDDRFLQEQVDKLRSDAFALQRRQRQGDAAALRTLAEAGESMGVAPSLLAAIRFESIVALTKTKPLVRAQILKAVTSTLPGWDKTQRAIDPVTEKNFRLDPVTAYENANDELRTQMHRHFYRTVKLPEFLLKLKADGSNGMEVADELKKELPEETEQIKRLQTLYVDYRLSRVPFLTRRQLEELVRLLSDFQRDDEVSPAIQRWLDAQEKRLNNNQLDGILATADEYAFAFERWKDPDHRDVAADLYKRGWLLANKSAPKEAASIAQRLEQLGWTRLRDAWMTTEQVANLPRDDVALAMREGRVVAGMTGRQVVGALGYPSRTIRVVSSRRIEEIWVYGEKGTSSITVHVERGRTQKPDQAIATLVSVQAE